MPRLASIDATLMLDVLLGRGCLEENVGADAKAFSAKGARQVRVSDFGRFALGTCVLAALLAGCGGSKPPAGATGTAPQIVA